jgi:arylsulfatase A-like enzyme
MSPKPLSTIIALSALFCGQAPTAEPSKPATTGRPNIVYIVADNVTFEHMGKAYGGENVTPAMDSIADRGVRFERMYVPTPLCVPSRYSILTGRYPERCTAAHYLESEPPGEPFYDVSGIELEPGRANLPSVLGSAGYRTGYVGKFHLYHGELGPELAPKEKVHISDPEITRIMREKNDALAAHIKTCGFEWVGGAEAGNGYPVENAYRQNLDNEGAKHNLEWEIASALEFIDQSAKGDKPFFLYLATQMYHLTVNLEKNLLGDYERVGRYTERGCLDKAPEVPMPSRKEIVAEAQRLRPPAERKERREYFLSSGHDAEFMLWLDYGVKALLDRLASLGVADNTIVVFISDNNQSGKSTAYEGGIHVPSAMMWPKGIPAGQENRHIVSSLDIAATLLDAARRE